VVPIVPLWPMEPALPVVPTWPAAPVEVDPAPEPAACGVMFEASRPPVAKGLCSEEVGAGAADCLQWSATWVTLVTWKVWPALALLLVPAAFAPVLVPD
jgi:hypothetical protein